MASCNFIINLPFSILLFCDPRSYTVSALLLLAPAFDPCC
jgi:hypothetical protein